MTRIAITLPDELLDEFDECLKERGYHSRSKGIKDTIKEYINETPITSELTIKL